MKRKLLYTIPIAIGLIVSGCSSTNVEEQGAEAVEEQVNEEVEQPQVSSLIYVPNAGEGTVSVIDQNDSKVVDTISLGTEQASHGIALSLDGKQLYTGTGFAGKSLVVIDTETKEKINEMKFDEGVHGIDLSPDGQYLYISLNPGLNEKGGSLVIVKTETFEKIAKVETDEGPAHVAVTPNGSQVWVANVNADTVSVVETKTNTLLKTIEVADVPNEVAISPDGKWAYVANVESDIVSVIDVESLNVVKTTPAGDGPHGVTVSPNGTELWVSNNNSNDITVIDTKTLTTKVSIPTGSYANHVAFSLDGEWAYVTNRKSNDVVKINVVKKEVTAKIPVGVEPHEISLEDYVSTSFEPIEYTFSSTAGQVVSTEASTAIDADIQKRLKSGNTDSVIVDALRLLPSDKIEGQQIDFEKYDAFQIGLTTHSGDLSSLPLDKNTFLIDSNNNKIEPAEWIVQSNDSHHPLYLVLFPKTDSDQVSVEVGALSDQPVVLTWQ